MGRCSDTSDEAVCHNYLERKHVMSVSLFQKRENRQIAVRIGSHEHVEVVTEEIAFPVRIPAPVTVRLRVLTFAGTLGTIRSGTFTGAFLTLGSDSYACDANEVTVVISAECMVSRRSDGCIWRKNHSSG